MNDEEWAKARREFTEALTELQNAMQREASAMAETETQGDGLTLTAQDRCDGCAARAVVVVLLPYGELLFCGHHYHRSADRLTEAGAVLLADDREKASRE